MLATSRRVAANSEAERTSHMLSCQVTRAMKDKAGEGEGVTDEAGRTGRSSEDVGAAGRQGRRPLSGSEPGVSSDP